MMATSLLLRHQTILPRRLPTSSAGRSTTWNPTSNANPFLQCNHSSGIHYHPTPCLPTAHLSTASRPTSPPLVLPRQPHSTRPSSTRTMLPTCTPNVRSPPTSSRTPCLCLYRCPVPRPTAPTHGNITTTSAAPLSHSSPSPRTATSARHVTRPSRDPAVYAYTATATPAKSPTSVRNPVVAKPSASAAT
jgi:hypothetical protein